MKITAIQWTVTTVIASIVLAIEWCTGATLADKFIEQNGLLLISALLAINVASLAALISIMQNLEQQYNRPFYFDKSKKAALFGVKELLVLVSLFFLLMAAVPECYWDLYNNKGFSKCEVILSIVVAVFSRTFVFQSLYATYDFSKSIINITTCPEDVKFEENSE